MSEDFNWTVHYEGQLLDAMVGHKPVGKLLLFYVKKYCIQPNLKTSTILLIINIVCIGKVS